MLVDVGRVGDRDAEHELCPGGERDRLLDEPGAEERLWRVGAGVGEEIGGRAEADPRPRARPCRRSRTFGRC